MTTTVYDNCIGILIENIDFNVKLDTRIFQSLKQFVTGEKCRNDNIRLAIMVGIL